MCACGGGPVRDWRKGRGGAPCDDAASTLPQPRLTVRELVAESVAGMLQRPGRAALTALGTVLGIGSFVALLGLTTTAAGQISREFTVVRATEVQVVENPPPGAPSMPFPADSSDRLAAVDGVVSAGTWWQVPVGDGTTTSARPDASGVRLGVVAVDPGALDAAQITLAEGRAYDRFAEDAHERVALLGAAAARELGITRLDTGPAVFVGDDAYTVVGIVADTRRLPLLLSAVVLPASTALERYGPPDPSTPATVLVRTRVGAAQVVADQAPVALRPDAPGLLVAVAPPDPDDLRSGVTRNVDGLLVALASVALLIGALGIANTTLVAVVERTGEIGLRRALGATRGHVTGQLLVEAGLLGGLGGLVGTACGTLVVVGVSVLQRWTPVLDPTVLYVAPVAGVVVGVLAGFHPARRAARIEPAAALRS